ncbi:MAG: acyl-ACP desaturase [Bacteroidetes bacterium]|nr:acyl-ACP desaturase [Bacteroidota bacterium]
MNQALSPGRSEVMLHIGKDVETISETYLNEVETNWQASELLPLTSDDSFISDLKTIQEQASNLSYDLLAVLVVDTITEEALPTYETWLANLHGVNQEENNNWMKWIRAWTAEENRHGDVLNRYLYLCGRINMREFEASTQYLIRDGFDNGASNDPYRNFVYTSFQELATNISHRRVASLAKSQGNTILSKLCGLVAADEARHAKAYKAFVSKIFELDPNEMMLAFEDMMKKKIVMPAQYLRELGEKVNSFASFSDCAQRLGVYTPLDYVDILKGLIDDWKIENVSGLKENGEKARDYLIHLPDRLTRIADRMKISTEAEFKFNWILG